MIRMLIKQNHQKEYLVLFGCLLFLLTACQDDKLDIPDTSRKITINGLITTDKLLNVRISKSAYLTDESSSEQVSLYSIDNAQVLIYQNNNVIDSLYFNEPLFDFSFYDNLYQNGNYVSKYIFPITGKEYKVIAKVPGMPEASSITTIPDLVRIERVDTSRIIVAEQNPSNVRLICNIEFIDPANETNYYLFNIYKNYKESGSMNSDNMGFLCNDPIVEEKLIGHTGSALSGDPIRGIAFTDKIINGQISDLTVTISCTDIGLPFWIDDPNYNGDGNHRKVIYFRLYSITEEYFKYIQTLNKYNKDYDNPLAKPELVYSNVTGGYGIFAGAAVSSDSIVFTY
jgi:Domain of unknown function (DUF4249)